MEQHRFRNSGAKGLMLTSDFRVINLIIIVLCDYRVIIVWRLINWQWKFISAYSYGDPQLTTLDGQVYSFNGRGEYVLMRVKSR